MIEDYEEQPLKYHLKNNWTKITYGAGMKTIFNTIVDACSSEDSFKIKSLIDLQHKIGRALNLNLIHISMLN